MFASVLLAFSMFSAIPMPRTEWNEKNMRYMMCAFPLVGVVIGALVQGVWALASCAGAEADFCAMVRRLMPLVLVLIPVAVTGGIHVDGFMDTCDALSSHADREKKLAIMKDSHAGAFSVLGCVLYFLADFVLFGEWCRGSIGVLPLIFVFSRLLSAFSVATFPIAKDSGLVRTFSDAGAKRFTAVWCAFWFVSLAVVAVFCFRWQGGAVVLAQVIVFAWYFVMTRRQFGGITGDTAGWFVQMAEIVSLAAGLFARAL
ncbi:MAG: adenosylcobinamide-GDP ribazoletransferase [Treponema sp.]|nr:adenosylcobinamide-GDP ribazoletransferase [Treponema sp.]